MISLGGVLGAGLFVGSGAVINQTGPAAVLSYLAAGALVVLVIACSARWRWRTRARAEPCVRARKRRVRVLVRLDQGGGDRRPHIPAAAQVMNAIVLTAVLSCLNSGLYVASRMNFALARRHDAPQWMVRLNGRGVPARAIVIATSIGFLSVIADVVSPNKVFLFLLNTSGAVALFIYLLICVSQLWLGLLSIAVVLGAYFVRRSVGQHAGGDSGQSGRAVGQGRFSAREDRQGDPASVPLQ
jgi:amino acid transporter